MTYEIDQYRRKVAPDLCDLIERAKAEGHGFVARTENEWNAGANRFDLKGEALFLASIEGRIVGMCGLNKDPYLDDQAVGRLRHLYVHPSDRRSGIAEALVARCLSLARQSFSSVRLRTSNPAADALYRSMGFDLVDDPTATHAWSP